MSSAGEDVHFSAVGGDQMTDLRTQEGKEMQFISAYHFLVPHLLHLCIVTCKFADPQVSYPWLQRYPVLSANFVWPASFSTVEYPKNIGFI